MLKIAICTLCLQLYLKEAKTVLDIMSGHCASVVNEYANTWEIILVWKK